MILVVVVSELDNKKCTHIPLIFVDKALHIPNRLTALLNSSIRVVGCNDAIPVLLNLIGNSAVISVAQSMFLAGYLASLGALSIFWRPSGEMENYLAVG